MKITKALLRPERLRQVPEQFSWVDQALVQRHIIRVVPGDILFKNNELPLGYLASCIKNRRNCPKGGIIKAPNLMISKETTAGTSLLTNVTVAAQRCTCFSSRWPTHRV